MALQPVSFKVVHKSGRETLCRTLREVDQVLHKDSQLYTWGEYQNRWCKTWMDRPNAIRNRQFLDSAVLTQLLGDEQPVIQNNNISESLGGESILASLISAFSTSDAVEGD